MFKARHLAVRAYTVDELTNPNTCPPEVKVVNSGGGVTHLIIYGQRKMPLDNGHVLVLTEDGEVFRVRKNEFSYFFVKDE